MKHIASVPLFAALLLAAAGCGAKAGKAPEDTFEALRSAFADRDFGKVFDLLAGAELERATKQLETDRALTEEERLELCRDLGIEPSKLDTMSAREYYVLSMEARAKARPEAIDRFGKAEFVSAKADGDRCVLTVRFEGKERPLELTRRDGRWFVSRL